MIFPTPQTPVKIQAFPTLVCNQNCPYCANRVGGDHRLVYELAPAEKWIKALNGFENVEVIGFCGGESTLYPGLADVINGLRPFSRITIGSNGWSGAVKVAKQIRPRKDFIVNISYHPTQVMLRERFLRNCREIADIHPVHVHCVNNPVRKGEILEAQEWFKARGINMAITTFFGYDERGNFHPPHLLDRCGAKERRAAVCHFDFVTPVAPDGTVYACHYLMYSQSDFGRMGNIFTGEGIKDGLPKSLLCPHYGFCNICEGARTIEPAPKGWDLVPKT